MSVGYAYYVCPYVMHACCVMCPFMLCVYVGCVCYVSCACAHGCMHVCVMSAMYVCCICCVRYVHNASA